MSTNFLLLTETIRGGEWIATSRLINELARTHSDYSFSLLAFGNKNDVELSGFKQKIFISHFKAKKPFKFGKSLLGDFFKIKMEIGKMQDKTKFDYVLSTNYLMLLSVFGTLLKNTKLIFLFHGLRSIPFRKLSDIDYRQILTKILERCSWIYSDAITVPSRAAGDYIWNNVKWMAIKRKIFLVPNIVPTAFFVNKEEKYNIGHYNILYSGRLGKYKGLENLIPAFYYLLNQIPQANLSIAYPSSSVELAIVNTIKSLVKKYGLEGKVEFVEDLTETELAGVYRRSDVLVLPSELEFAPLSVLESLAAGTPVIGTNVGNVGNLLQKIDPGLILKDNSSDEILKKLILFYKYGKEKKRILEKKSVLVASYFSEDKACREFKKVLNFSQNSISH